MSARLIRRFSEIVALVENGELEQGCNEAVTQIFERLQDASEGAKASITLKIDFQLKNGIVEFGSEEPAVKLPKRKYRKAIGWIHEGALSLQHPKQIDMFGPREVPSNSTPVQAG
jgi:hypothetical protein